MRPLRALLLLLAVVVVAARLFTGIVYEQDDPTAYLVLKPSPSLTTVEQNAADGPVPARFWILDGADNELGCEKLYLPAMRYAFAIAAVLVGLAWIAGPRRRASRSSFG